MSPSHFYSSWKDFPRPPNDFEKLNSAYATGDYTTAIELLNFLPTNITDQVNNVKLERREHVLLARAICFQQMREHQHVVSDTTEVAKITTVNAPRVVNDDHTFCRILALWLRSLALESLENWERAKSDLDALKELILRYNMITFRTEGVLSVFLCHITPLIANYKPNKIMFNLSCVEDNLNRMKKLVAKDIARRNNPSQEFHLIDEDVKNCNDLAKKFHYRLLLRRPLHPNIHMNMWYTLDLMFVSEMGLFKREDLIGVQGYTLGCKLLEINSDKEMSEKYEVQVRPMSAESREWSDCSDTNWAGVQNRGKGGLEFRVIHTNKQPEFAMTNGCNGSSVSNYSSNEFSKLPKSYSSVVLNTNGLERNDSPNYQQLYLYVYPIQAIVDENFSNKKEKKNNEYIQENNLVPLCIGPIYIVNCEKYFSTCVHHLPSNSSNGFVTIAKPPHVPTEVTTTSGKSRKKSPWSMDDCLVDNYRCFILPNEQYLIIKELWDAGIPGKVWDSAFIIAQMIKDKILKHQTIFTGKKILDLSTGTGFVGLFLAAFLSTLKPDKSDKNMNNSKTTVTLTDLDHALKLVRGNLEMNKYILDSNNKVTVKVEALQWGDLSKAKNLGIIDYVFASDVVYEPELFDSLINTLITVCTPGRTKVYLGYKRRGLTKEEEDRFFGKLQKNFQRSVVQGLGNLAEEGKVNVYELRRIENNNNV